MSRELDDISTRVSRLTHDQREALRAVARHESSKVQERLTGVSRHTIDGRIKRALKLLDMTDRFEAALAVARVERDATVAHSANVPGALVDAERLVDQSPDLPYRRRPVAPSLCAKDPRAELNDDDRADQRDGRLELAGTGDGPAVAGAHQELAGDGRPPVKRRSSEVSEAWGGGYATRAWRDLLWFGRSVLPLGGTPDHQMNAPGVWSAVLIFTVLFALIAATATWALGFALIDLDRIVSRYHHV